MLPTLMVLEELGKDSKTVVRRVGAVVVGRSIVVGEADQSHILDPVPLIV